MEFRQTSSDYNKFEINKYIYYVFDKIARL